MAVTELGPFHEQQAREGSGAASSPPTPTAKHQGLGTADGGRRRGLGVPPKPTAPMFPMLPSSGGPFPKTCVQPPSSPL